MERLNNSIPNKHFWKNKKVFITGHTGFKGSWLSLWLINMGANIKGYSLPPNTTPNLYSTLDISKKIISEYGDILNYENLKKSITEFEPEIIIHLAAQPLVRKSYKEPKQTYETNVIGTLNILDIAKDLKYIKSILLITTDKCYENKEWDWGYRENDRLGGHDPYSSSKACCEILIESFRKSFFNNDDSANVASARAGNVIGGGDWSEDRLIPDIIKSANTNEPLFIRNPFATRPWQHVLEPLSGYLILSEKLYFDSSYSESWNFGPEDIDCKTVKWIIENFKNILAKDLNLKLSEVSNPHEANLLKLDISKVKNKLNWNPRFDVNEAINMTAEWYNCFENNSNIIELSEYQIKKYCKEE